MHATDDLFDRQAVPLGMAAGVIVMFWTVGLFGDLHVGLTAGVLSAAAYYLHNGKHGVRHRLARRRLELATRSRSYADPPSGRVPERGADTGIPGPGCHGGAPWTGGVVMALPSGTRLNTDDQAPAGIDAITVPAS
jgi:hypothetical protein